MLGNQFSYKGFSFPWGAQEARDAGWVADVRWKDLTTRTKILNKENYHGGLVSPTLASPRLITVSGQIFSTDKTTRGLIRNAVDAIFTLEGIPEQGKGLYPLVFTDDDGKEWSTMAQVYNMPRYEHDRGAMIIEFSAELIAPDPVFRSFEDQGGGTVYGRIGGGFLPTKLPIVLDSLHNALQLTNAGNFDAQTTITIKGDIVRPTVHHLETGRFWKQDRTLTGENELIINSREHTVSYNGDDDLFMRYIGSNFIYLRPGTNTLILTGDDYDVDNQGKATMDVVYNSSML